MRSITSGIQQRVFDLEKEIEELKEHKKEKKDQYSHIVQMLILDYLGVGKHIENNYQKAEIYAQIIRRDLETTRQYLSKLNGEKNDKNLKTILDFFDRGGFSVQVELVKKDIDRLKRK
jgi:hypothetical protein